MESSNRHEAFIPFPRQDILQLCLEDGGLKGEAVEDFQTFCEILAALFHLRFHRTLEEIKENYQVFDPNAEVYPLHRPDKAKHQQMSHKIARGFQVILERANYLPMTKADLQEALDAPSLRNLKAQVDFSDFEHVLCYYRGKSTTTIIQKRFFLWQRRRTVQTFERLVLLIQFKGEEYFRTDTRWGKRQESHRRFIPGKIYLFFYKNLPRPDLRLLFPNLKTRMAVRDRLLLMVPAAGAAVPLGFRLLFNILLILLAVWVIWNPDTAHQVIQPDLRQKLDIAATLFGLSAVIFAIGLFARQQYTLYKAKRLQFQKEIIDTLFFNLLATHASVFQMLCDIAEEEECKEIILVYYHLLVSSAPLAPDELKAHIETWLLKKTGTNLNFDIQGPLRTMQTMGGKVAPFPATKPLLSYDGNGRCTVLPLTEANALLRYIWNHAFRVSK